VAVAGSPAEAAGVERHHLSAGLVAGERLLSDTRCRKGAALSVSQTKILVAPGKTIKAAEKPMADADWAAPPTARHGLGRIRWQRVAVVAFVAMIGVGIYTGFQRCGAGGRHSAL